MAGSGFVHGWTYAAEARRSGTGMYRLRSRGCNGRERLWAGAEKGAGFEDTSHRVRPARQTNHPVSSYPIKIMRNRHAMGRPASEIS
jgi:hypothetical protein